MNYKFKYTDKIVSIFILVAMVAFIGLLVAIAVKQKIFVTTYTFKARFFDAVGMTTATPIYFKGYEIGRISKFTLNEENLIDAEIVVDEDYRNKIVENSAFNKTTSPISGSSSIELLQGPDLKRVLPEGGFIPSINVPEGKILLDNKTVSKTGDVVSSIMTNVDKLLEGLNSDQNSKDGALFRTLVNLADASQNMNESMKSINILVRKLNTDFGTADGTLFKTIANVNKLAEELTAMTAQLNKTLVSSDTLINRYGHPEGLGKKLIDPDGKMIIEPINAMLTTMNATLREMNQLLLFLNSRTPEMSLIISRSAETIQNANSTLQGINNNPLIRDGIPKSQSSNPTSSPVQRPVREE